MKKIKNKTRMSRVVDLPPGSDGKPRSLHFTPLEVKTIDDADVLGSAQIQRGLKTGALREVPSGIT